MKILLAIISILTVGCAPTMVQQQAFYYKSENIQNQATIMNNFTTEKYVYHVIKVDDVFVGSGMHGSLAINEMLVKPGKHELYLYSSLNNSASEGKVTCDTKPGKYYVVNRAEKGESQGAFFLGDFSKEGITSLACFEYDEKPENINIKNKKISKEIIYK